MINHIDHHQHVQSTHQHLVNHRTQSANQQSDDYEDDHGMRVGQNYQAEIPEFIAYGPAPEYYEDERAIRVWSPHNKIPDHILDEFLTKAKEKFFYTTEQALGMLSWHKFDLNRAYADLPNFVPFPNEWSVEDKVLFEQAYQFHEKQFQKIKQMLPDKSMANLISYYYGWKKTRTRASLMERQTRRFASRKTTDSNGNSDVEDEDDENAEQNDNVNERSDPARNQNVKSKDTDNAPGDENVPGAEVNYGADDVETDVACSICKKMLRFNNRNCHVIVDGVTGKFCFKCYNEWKAHGKTINRNPTIGDCYYEPLGEQKRMLFSYNDVISLIEGSAETGEVMLKQIDIQIESLKREIQTRKQTISQIDEKIQPIADQIANLNMDEFSNILPEYKPTNDWTPEEMQLAIQGIRRYGMDFSAIADLVRTKTPENIRVFYATQQDRLGLKRLVNELTEDVK